jgi:hypothetical protein
MPDGSKPAGAVANRSVTVSWSAVSLPGGAAGSYTVRRYTTGGALQSIGASCSGAVAATSCVETAVPPGTWRYTVAPRVGNWVGAEGALSDPVAVAAASASITSGSPIATLPSTLGVSLAGFASGQTVTYRLDDPVGGTLLSGTTVPSTIPAGGGATASVTIPTGTSGGSHTLYAVGTSGDVASAAFTVDTTVSVGAWSLGDASSGIAADASAEPAFAGDGLVFRTARFDNAFATGRYLDFDMAAPLPAGQAVTGATFNLRYAAQAGGQTACFFLELRRASTGAVLSTHGSSGSPLGCVTGTSQQTFATALPALTTSALANDVRVRVFVSQSASRAIDVDLATLSGSAALAPFTVHAAGWTDAADTSPATTVWPLAAQDGAVYETAANWTTAFDAARRVDVKFPAHVPAGATVRGATFKHVWQTRTSGLTACWYAETWSGGALIGSHGSAAAPISCRAMTGAVTDTLTLPEVNTPARANDLTVRIYVRVTSGVNRRTHHDLTELSVTYGS